jgi:hypothetical protein
MIEIVETISRAYVDLSVLAVVVVGVDRLLDRWRAAKRRRVMLSFCHRDAAGNIFIQDPQTGALHNFRDLMERRIVSGTDERTARQKRRARRDVRRQVRAGAR